MFLLLTFLEARKVTVEIAGVCVIVVEINGGQENDR